MSHILEKTLFISDLDGTLLNSESKLTDTSVSLLNRAIANGINFSIATARTPSTVSYLLKDVKARLPYIVMTGAAIWNPLTDKFSNPVYLGSKSASEILGIFIKHDLPVFIYKLKEDKIHIYHYSALSSLETEFINQRDKSKYKEFHLNIEIEKLPLLMDEVSLFYAMQPSAEVEAVFNEVRNKIDCNPVFYHDIFGEEIGLLEIFSKDASKANALKKLKSQFGFERVIAFGDNVNDIPMMKEADVAVAVENAKDEVKDIADIIIGSNNNDSVAKFIYKESFI